MQSATLPTLIRPVGAPGCHGLLLINVSAAPDVATLDPAGRLSAAKGALVGMALSAGFWAAIIGFIAMLRH